jgi:ATP-dependent RNA helicase DeaD
MREIERIIGKKFERKEVPTPQHIIEKQLYNLADRIEKVKVDDNEIDKYLPGISKRLAWLSEQDLLKRVLSLEFNRLLDYYKDAPNIDYVDEKPSRGDRKGDRRGEKTGERKGGERGPRNDKEKDRRTAEAGYARVYVNAGKNAGFYAGNIIEMLNKNSQGKRIDVGRIDLMPGYSLLDVKKSDVNRAVAALKGNEFMGKRLYSEIASPDKDYAKASTRKSKEGKENNKEERRRRR